MLLLVLIWYLLRELAVVLRPLFLAVFLAYVVIPIQSQLRKRSQGFFSSIILLVFVITVLGGVYLVVYRNIVELSEDLPDLAASVRNVMQDGQSFVDEHWPAFLRPVDSNQNPNQPGAEAPEEPVKDAPKASQKAGQPGPEEKREAAGDISNARKNDAQQGAKEKKEQPGNIPTKNNNIIQPGLHGINEIAGNLVNSATSFFIEAIEVCFYLFFIMIEGGRLPERIRKGFPFDRAAQILEVIAGINKAMAEFLKVKVRASLILALPITAVLWGMGIKFFSLWGMLFFLSNFVPYFGSLVIWLSVSFYSFLQLGFGWKPIALSLLLLFMRTISSDLVEPRITGKAINVSPLVILFSLAFWSLCWGPVGMVLAVPVAVMLKIILQSLDPTRPFATLMAEE
jgi:predicted PurR-regulated permease PerM